MFECKKICESEYFYNRMVQEQSDYNNFMFNLSAFLTSTRSAIQYVLEEAKTKDGGKEWYDSIMAGSPILQYFKEKRDTNIHAEPINPWIQWDIFVPLLVTRHETESVEETMRKIGLALHKVVLEQDISNEERDMLKRIRLDIQGAGIRCENSYTFSDWSGQENALKLCEMYLSTLKAVVDEGKTKRFLSPECM